MRKRGIQAIFLVGFLALAVSVFFVSPVRVATAEPPPIMYTLTFHHVPEGMENPNPEFYIFGVELVLLPLENNGDYIFLGWFDGEMGGPGKKWDVISATQTLNVHLWARWIHIDDTLGTIIYVSVPEEVEITDNPNPTRFTPSEEVVLVDLDDTETHIFLGWFDEEGNEVTSILRHEVEEVTVYAHWEEIIIPNLPNFYLLGASGILFVVACLLILWAVLLFRSLPKMKIFVWQQKNL